MDDGGSERKDLVRLLRRRFANLPDIELASEDIVGQAFLDVLRSARGTELVGHFGYMAKVCDRLACRVYRLEREEAARREEMAEGSMDTIAGVDDPERAFLDGEAIAAIAASLEVLREVERAIIERRYYGEASFQEIARDSGIKLSTVLSHHRRALERLRPRLAKYFEERAGTSRVVGSARDPQASMGTASKFI